MDLDDLDDSEYVLNAEFYDALDNEEVAEAAGVVNRMAERGVWFKASSAFNLAQKQRYWSDDDVYRFVRGLSSTGLAIFCEKSIISWTTGYKYYPCLIGALLVYYDVVSDPNAKYVHIILRALIEVGAPVFSLSGERVDQVMVVYQSNRNAFIRLVRDGLLHAARDGGNLFFDCLLDHALMGPGSLYVWQFDGKLFPALIDMGADISTFASSVTGKLQLDYYVAAALRTGDFFMLELCIALWHVLPDDLKQQSEFFVKKPAPVELQQYDDEPGARRRIYRDEDLVWQLSESSLDSIFRSLRDYTNWTRRRDIAWTPANRNINYYRFLLEILDNPLLAAVNSGSNRLLLMVLRRVLPPAKYAEAVAALSRCKPFWEGTRLPSLAPDVPQEALVARLLEDYYVAATLSLLPPAPTSSLPLLLRGAKRQRGLGGGVAASPAPEASYLGFEASLKFAARMNRLERRSLATWRGLVSIMD